jgi:SAM-dependent methyltransferase
MKDEPINAARKIHWLTRIYIWACQLLYHELSWSYDWVSALVSFGRWQHWRRLALAYIPQSPVSSLQSPVSSFRPAQPPRVLELGFGTGELLVELAWTGNCVIGLDPSPAMQIVAAHKLERQMAGPSLVQALAQALPFANSTFDMIFATFPTNYIADESTLRECTRVLVDSSSAASGLAGRIVVVGLWVGLRPRWLQRLLPIFYGEPDARFVVEFERRLAAAGLNAAWIEHTDGIFVLPVLVAEKKSDNVENHADR